MTITYETLLRSMNEKFTELAGFSPDDASDIGIRLKLLAGELFSINSNIDWLKTQMFPQTATEFYLDLHAQQRGIIRKVASKSRGTLIFSCTYARSNDIFIPAGTICSTAQIEGIRVVTLLDAIIPAGDTTVSVLAESEVGGEDTNLSTNMVNILITPPAGIISVINSTAFTGGTSQETDEELRKRVLYSYKNISNGANSAFYRDCALAFEGVNSASIVSKPRGSGSVDIYIAAKGGLVSSELLSQVSDQISNFREINVDVQVKSPSVFNVSVSATITIKTGYQSLDVIESCKVNLQNYFDKLEIGENLKLADIYEVFYHTEGVDNYTIILPTSDYTISDSTLAVKNLIQITESPN